MLRALTAIGAGAATLPGTLAAAEQRLTWRNWSDSLYAEPAEVAAPETEAAIARLLREGRGTVRPIGSGHSWSGLVPTDGTMVTLDRLMGVISHDPASLQAEVWAGTKLFLLGPLLEQHGQGLPNMSDINYQSLAGAMATATHGTGLDLHAMPGYVAGLRLLTPAGDTLDIDREREADLFRAALCSLGSLGVITRFTLQNRESHWLHQREWLEDTDVALEQAMDMARANPQFELFLIPNSNRSIVVTTNPAASGADQHIEDEPYALHDLRDAFQATRWIPGIRDFIFDNALDIAFGGPSDRVGPSHAVLAHPRVVRFAEMEYTVPAERGVECAREVLALIRERAPEVCFPLEFRYIKADDSLIGMCSERDGCAISVHQFMDSPGWESYLAAIEPVFHKYGGRPHWGKWHSLSAQQLAGLYPHWASFRALRAELDPGGRMLNPYLAQLLGVT